MIYQQWHGLQIRTSGETINAVRQEVNNFVDAGLLTSELEGNKRFYKANTKHPLYEGLRVIVSRIMYLTMTDEKMKYFFKEKPTLLIWKSEK
jgi:DNA-binding transcriptional ArsR family regulator